MKPILLLVLLLTFSVTACATTPSAPAAVPSPTDALTPTAAAAPATETPLSTVVPTDLPAPPPTNTTAATAEPTSTNAPTEPAEPTKTAQPTETDPPAEPSPTAETEATVTPAVNGDIAHGKTLFVTNKCDSCHDVSNPFPGGEYGPNLGNISTEALNVIALPEYTGTATNAVEYIRESVMFPNIYIVPGPNYLDSPGVSNMTQDFADTVSEQDLNDLIAYLLSLDAR